MFWNKLSKRSKTENYNPATHFLLNVFWQKNSESPDQHYEKSWRLFPCSGLLSAYMAVPIILQMIFTAVLLNLCLSYFKCTTAKFRMHCSFEAHWKAKLLFSLPKTVHRWMLLNSSLSLPDWTALRMKKSAVIWIVICIWKLLRFLPIH